MVCAYSKEVDERLPVVVEPDRQTVAARLKALLPDSERSMLGVSPISVTEAQPLLHAQSGLYVSGRLVSYALVMC